jgi:predicted RND superfamily exporter protein
LLAFVQSAILARPLRVLTFSGLLVVLALVLGSGVELRTSRSELAPEDDPEQRRFEKFVQETGGTSTLIACIEATDGSERSIDELRDFTDRLAGEFARNPQVRQVYHKVDLDWFLERSLHLAPPGLLLAAIEAADRERGFLGTLADARGLADVNEALADRLHAALQEAATEREGAGPAVGYLVRLVDAERRFLEHPIGVMDGLEGVPPLRALAGASSKMSSGGYLMTRDGQRTFIFIARKDSDESLPALRDFVGSTRRTAEWVSALSPGFRVAFTGQPAMTVEEMDTVRRDTWFTSLVAAAGVIALTILVFRWKTHSVLVLLTLAAGIAWAFGAVRLELGYLNLITSSFISTLVGVGVAYAIHPVSEYELEGAHTIDPREAIREAYHRTGVPVTVAAVTTSAAFFSILLMEFRGFAELGLVAGVGVLLCLAACLVTLPALLMVYGRRRARRDRETRERKTSAVVDRLWVHGIAGRVCKFPKTVTLAALLATAALGWTARDIGFDTNIMDLLPRNAESVEYQQRMLMESDFSPVFCVVSASGLDELREMSAQAAAEPSFRRFESVLDALPADLDASSYAVRRIRPRLDAVRLPAAPEPVDRERLEASLRRLADVFEETSEEAFGAGMGELAGSLEEARASAEDAAETVRRAPSTLEAAWNDGQQRLLEWVRTLLVELRRVAAAKPPVLEDLPREVRERYVSKSGRLLGFLHPAGDVFDPDFLDSYVAAARKVSPAATGFPIVFHRMSDRITSGFYRAVAVGALLVLLILIIDYRNVRDAALAVVPLAMGVIWMLGWMSILNLSYNFANLVAVPLIIGVGIDNGVHVIHRVRLEGRGGMSIVLRHTGRAILIASLTTMIGFGSLALASHRGLASLGMVLLLGVGSCLFTSTVILPNLLVTLGITKN